MFSSPYKSIAYKMTMSVLIFSLLLTAVSVVGLYIINYREATNKIELNLEQLGKANLPAINASLWLMDRQLLQIQLNSLLNIPHVTAVKIESRGQLIASAGSAGTGRTLPRSFPLLYTFDNRNIPLGTLLVEVCYADIYKELFERTYVRLLFQVGQIALVALFMLYIFRVIVTRRLSVIYDHIAVLDAGRIDLMKDLPKPLIFRDEDELDMLVKTFNVMLERIEHGIREREVAENSLRDKEKLFSDVINTSLDGISLLDMDGIIIFANYREAEILGYCSPDDIIGKSGYDFIHPEDRQIAMGALGTILQHNSLYCIKYRSLRKDGTDLPVETNASLLRARDGAPVGIVSVMRDISERNRAEEEIRKLNSELESRVLERTAELERSNKQLEEFCYAISHEFRAPIARLEGFGTTMLEIAGAGTDESINHCAGRIVAASKRLRTVIDALLVMNRLSRTTMDMQSLDLSAMATQIVAEIIEYSGQENLNFSIEPHVTACGDLDMLGICLRNLLGNAIKYSAKRADASVGFGQKTIAGEKVYFVTDNGVGFNMDYVNKLFQPFCRLHKESEFEGSGIGLATARRIIERHNGRIWVEAAEGKGATFYFTLGFSI